MMVVVVVLVAVGVLSGRLQWRRGGEEIYTARGGASWWEELLGQFCGRVARGVFVTFAGRFLGNARIIARARE